jgi:hypothetical protein
VSKARAYGLWTLALITVPAALKGSSEVKLAVNEQFVCMGKSLATPA